MASTAILALLLACGDDARPPASIDATKATEATGQAQPGRFELEATSQAEPVEIDLAESLAGVWHDREFERLVFGPETRHRFIHGWYPARFSDDAPGYIESTGRSSAIEIPLVDIVDRLLVVDAHPIDAPDNLPEQVLRVVWNGHDLGRYVLDYAGTKLELEVPAGVQTLGLNRLRFEPLYWVSPATAAVAFDVRPIGFTMKSLRLIGGRQADSDQPEGVALEEGRLSIEAGGTLAWHVLAPDAARIVASVGWTGSARPTGGHLLIAVNTTDGQQQIIERRELTSLSTVDAGTEPDGVAAAVDAATEPGLLEIDLSRFAGQMIGVHVAVTSDAGEGAVVWDSPRLLGSQASAYVDTSSKQGDYDVLVLLFDTLRADHLSPYGSEEVETPHLETLAANGFTFANASSNASWTRPSAASLWTGLHPSAHRVNGTKARVPDQAPYLPSVMQEAGWRTVGISNNGHFSEAFGFARGFDAFHPYFRERQEVLEDASSVAAQVDRVWSRFLAPAFEAQSEQPVFALVHEIDPHSPYQAPEPFASMYDFGYEGNIDGWNVHDSEQGMRILKVVNSASVWMGEADRRQMHAQYMAEVSFVDAYVGEILERLEASGRRDRTLVVVVSDHGEQFFEHGTWGHGESLFEEELAVPLMFALPGVIPSGQRSSEMVELVDLAPTILDLVGLETPSAMQGRSLLPGMLAGPAAEVERRIQIARSSVQFLDRGTDLPSTVVYDSLRLGRWKLIRRSKARFGVPRYQFALYDLEKDPEEVLDLWPMEIVVGHTLKQQLAIKLDRDEQLVFESETVEELDPAVLENLRGLGYVE